MTSAAMFARVPSALAQVLAHQGGWDEALLVLVPIALFAAILVVANRRAKAIQQHRRSEAADTDEGVDR